MGVYRKSNYWEKFIYFIWDIPRYQTVREIHLGTCRVEFMPYGTWAPNWCYHMYHKSFGLLKVEAVF